MTTLPDRDYTGWPQFLERPAFYGTGGYFPQLEFQFEEKFFSLPEAAQFGLQANTVLSLAVYSFNGAPNYFGGDSTWTLQDTKSQGPHTCRLYRKVVTEAEAAAWVNGVSKIKYLNKIPYPGDGNPVNAGAVLHVIFPELGRTVDDMILRDTIAVIPQGIPPAVYPVKPESAWDYYVSVYSVTAYSSLGNTDTTGDPEVIWRPNGDNGQTSSYSHQDDQFVAYPNTQGDVFPNDASAKTFSITGAMVYFAKVLQYKAYPAIYEQPGCTPAACSIPVFDILQSLHKVALVYEYDQVINEGVTDTVLGGYLNNNYTLEALVDDICYLFRIERRYTKDGVIFYRSRELGTELVISAEIDGDELIPIEEDGAWSVLQSNFLNSSQVPTQISLKFLDPGNDFKENTLTSKRPDAKRTDPIKQLAIPLVMPVDQADQLVSQVLNDARAITQEHTFTLPPRYSWLTRGDNVIIRDRQFAFTVNISTTDINADNSVSCRGRSVYAQANTPKPDLPSIPRTATGGAIAGTTAFVLDIPTILPADQQSADRFEIYLGVAPENKESWPGGYLTRTPPEGGASTLFYQYKPNVVIYGTATSVLTDKRWVTDNDPLTVAFLNADWLPEWNNTRDELDADKYLNFAIYGAPGRWEIIRYEGYADGALYGIRRGMRGTELACGKHQPGDLVIIPNAGLAIQRLPHTSLDTQDTFRGVTQGASYARGQDVQPPAYTGAARRPFAPALVRASRATSGDVALSWVRRDRASDGSWGPQPQSETVLAFTVKIYSGNSVVRTIDVTEAEETIYTEAQQISDGFAGSATLRIEVTQIGDIGPGFSEVRTIDVRDDA